MHHKQADRLQCVKSNITILFNDMKHIIYSHKGRFCTGKAVINYIISNTNRTHHDDFDTVGNWVLLAVDVVKKACNFIYMFQSGFFCLVPQHLNKISHG